jgi:hypothetical protein
MTPFINRPQLLRRSTAQLVSQKIDLTAPAAQKILVGTAPKAGDIKPGSRLSG